MNIAVILIITAEIAFIMAILHNFFSKPGPKGERGEKGKDGFMCDDLTKERIISLLQQCEEIELPNTLLKVKNMHKVKRAVK